MDKTEKEQRASHRRRKQWASRVRESKQERKQKTENVRAVLLMVNAVEDTEAVAVLRGRLQPAAARGRKRGRRHAARSNAPLRPRDPAVRSGTPLVPIRARARRSQRQRRAAHRPTRDQGATIRRRRHARRTRWAGSGAGGRALRSPPRPRGPLRVACASRCASCCHRGAHGARRERAERRANVRRQPKTLAAREDATAEQEHRPSRSAAPSGSGGVPPRASVASSCSRAPPP